MRLIDADTLIRDGYVLHRTYQQDEKTMVCETKRIEDVPTIQPEPSIPLSWIDEQIERLKGMDNSFATLTAMQISVMVKKWNNEQDEQGHNIQTGCD